MGRPPTWKTSPWPRRLDSISNSCNQAWAGGGDANGGAGNPAANIGAYGGKLPCGERDAAALGCALEAGTLDDEDLGGAANKPRIDPVAEPIDVDIPDEAPSEWALLDTCKEFEVLAKGDERSKG